MAEALRREAEVLDQQIATSEILRVIAGAETDPQPVFDTIAANALVLCRAASSLVTRFDGEMVHVVAIHNVDPKGAEAHKHNYPMALNRGAAAARAMLTRAVAHVSDVLEDADYGHLDVARAAGYRSVLAVPMLRDGAPIGAITVFGAEAAMFSERQVELLKTFADQAVIAVENTRLFNELRERTDELTRSVGQLTALGEVGRAVGSTLDLETVLSTIVERAVQLSETDGGIIYEYDETQQTFHIKAWHQTEAEHLEALRTSPIRLGEGALGRAAATRQPIEVEEILAKESLVAPQTRYILGRLGYQSLLAIPILREDRILGALVVWRRERGRFPREVVDLVQTFATQSALAIQNARLFLEIEDKSRKLETASQHKSEFLASMSHELRTPLNSIIGFSDVLLEGMFGEMTDKQTEYLKDILASGQHLLSLINDILDLSKIEAGQMDLDLADFDLPSAIDDALLLMRERAARRGLALERHVDERLGEIRADQRKVKQVLLNLLSNAVKFTPEGGRVDVRAALVDGTVEISVTDTGIGIAPEDYEAVFEEFRQVGKSDKKAEGTGLGLALCRKFVELHGGRIWVKSAMGQGSTFTFTLPVRRDPSSEGPLTGH